MRKYFQDFDKDNDGNISFAEFSEVLGKYKLEAKDIDVINRIHNEKKRTNNIQWVIIGFFFFFASFQALFSHFDK